MLHHQELGEICGDHMSMNKRLLILFAVLLLGGGLVWLIRWNNGREVTSRASQIRTG